MCPSDDRPSGQLRWFDVTVLCSIAFVVRLAVILASADSPLFSDMVDYHARALVFLNGQALPDSLRGPGYPAWLAFLYAIPGDDLFAARIGNAVLGAGSVWLTALLALEFVGRRGAIAAGLVVALYPASVIFSVYIMTEGLYAFLVLATMVVARRGGLTRTMASGVLTGLAALTRSLGIALIPTLAAGYFLQAIRHEPTPRRWAAATVRVAILGLACLITLSPWLRHTSQVSGGFMLDSSSAMNVLLGNNPRARERLQLEEFTWVWQTYLGGPIDEAERNARALRHGLNWVRSNPLRALQLAGQKMVYLWGLEGREHAWAYSHGYFGERDVRIVKLWGFLLVVSFAPLAGFAVIGLLRPGLLESVSGLHLAVILGLTTALHGISFSETRFHLPLVPILAVLAARGAIPGRALTPTRWVMAILILIPLLAGWWHQLPELLESYTRLTVPGGASTMRPY